MRYLYIIFQYILLFSPFICSAQDKFDNFWTLGYAPNDSIGLIGGSAIRFAGKLKLFLKPFPFLFLRVVCLFRCILILQKT
jgi:hypothetical protein